MHVREEVISSTTRGHARAGGNHKQHMGMHVREEIISNTRACMMKEEKHKQHVGMHVKEEIISNTNT